VHHQLLVRRVEPEPRRQLQVLTAAAHRVPLEIDRSIDSLAATADLLSAAASLLLLMVGRGEEGLKLVPGAEPRIYSRGRQRHVWAGAPAVAHTWRPGL
jgi:hypothetical protein